MLRRFLKYFSSFLNFRRGRNKIGELPEGMKANPLGRNKKFDSVVGNLVSFNYISPTATLPDPLVLITIRKGRNGKWFKFKGSDVRQNTYIQGLLLNNISDFWKAFMIRKFSKRGFITYHELFIVNKLTKSNFRVYNDRYIKEMKVVNALQFVRNQLGEI